MSEYKRFINNLQNLEEEHLEDLKECLTDNAEDILFRTYDLLFTVYPNLRSGLPINRYQHPDLVTLLSESKTIVLKGIDSLKTIIRIIEPRSDAELIECLVLIQQCLIRASIDVLRLELNQRILDMYSTIIEQRTLQTLGNINPKKMLNYCKTETI